MSTVPLILRGFSSRQHVTPCVQNGDQTWLSPLQTFAFSPIDSNACVLHNFRESPVNSSGKLPTSYGAAEAVHGVKNESCAVVRRCKYLQC